MIQIRFERHSYTHGIRDVVDEVTYGPFDWIEAEGNQLIAESDEGQLRFDPLAIVAQVPRGAPTLWQTMDKRQWHYFCVSAYAGTRNLPRA